VNDRYITQVADRHRALLIALPGRSAFIAMPVEPMDQAEEKTRGDRRTRR